MFEEKKTLNKKTSSKIANSLKMENFFCGSKEVELVLVEDANDFIDPLETDIFLDSEVLQMDENKLQLNDDVYGYCNLLSPEQTGECDSSTSAIITTVDTVKIDVKNEHCIDSCTSSDDNNSKDIYIQKSNLKSESKASKSDDDKQNDRYSDDPNSMEVNKIANKPRNALDSNHLGSRKIDEKRTRNGTKKMTRSVSIEEIPIGKKSIKKQEELVEFRVRPDPKRKRADARAYSQRNAIPKKTEHNEAYDKKLLKCKICDIQFEKSPYFTEHMRNEHGIDKPFECYICTKTYRICSLLAEHIRYHFGEKPYICSIESCNRSFSQLQPFKAHVRKFHTGEKPYKCPKDECKETFFDTKSLKEHIREHNPSTIPYQCEHCSKRFHHSGTFKAHMRIHTEDDKPFQCEICGCQFRQKSTYNAHMLTHSNEYKFACNYKRCDKTFKQRTSLKAHLRTHLKTNDRPHICSDCGRAFAQLVSYRNHRLIHTGERPFSCTYVSCTRTFRHRNSLKRHQLTHSGERPYHCNFCLTRFCQVSSLNKHMKKHQKNVE